MGSLLHLCGVVALATTQVPLSQQPSRQGKLDEHATPQRLAVQAWPGAHCVLSSHVHAPSLQSLPPAQAAHRRPSLPHSVSTVPGAQVPPLQHPLRQLTPRPHIFGHSPSSPQLNSFGH